MSRLRDQLKQIIRNQLTDVNINPPKYRLGIVAKSNSDGTCLVILDGTQVVATPIYPVVQGQQVALVIGDAGKISAVPTSPNSPQTEFAHPPFFTGGGFRFAIVEFGLGVNKAAVRVQDAGSSKIYRLVLPNPDPTVGIGNIALSPNGQFLAIAENVGSQSSTASSTPFHYRIYDIGSKLVSTGAIPGVPDGFFLQATLVSDFTVLGNVIAFALYTSPPGSSQESVVYGFSGIFQNAQCLFVTNSKQLYATEIIAKNTSAPGGIPATELEIAVNLINFQGGVRTVLATTVIMLAQRITAFPAPLVVSGSSIVPDAILDTTRNGTLSRTNPAPTHPPAANDFYTLLANDIAFFPGGRPRLTNSVEYEQSFSPVSTLESPYSVGYVNNSIMAVGKSFNTKMYAIENASFVITGVKALAVASDGTQKEYTFNGNISLFQNTNDFSIAALPDKKFLLVSQTNTTPPIITVYNAVIDEDHLTFTNGSPVIVSPGNPDSGYTDNQFRTGDIDSSVWRVILSPAVSAVSSS